MTVRGIAEEIDKQTLYFEPRFEAAKTILQQRFAYSRRKL